MSIQSYQIVASKYLELLSDLGYQPCCMSEEDPFHRSHLAWMLQEIIYNDNQSTTKKHRWLGFVQGVLCHQGLLSVSEERNNTREIFNGE